MCPALGFRCPSTTFCVPRWYSKVLWCPKIACWAPCADVQVFSAAREFKTPDAQQISRCPVILLYCVISNGDRCGDGPNLYPAILGWREGHMYAPENSACKKKCGWQNANTPYFTGSLSFGLKSNKPVMTKVMPLRQGQPYQPKAPVVVCFDHAVHIFLWSAGSGNLHFLGGFEYGLAWGLGILKCEASGPGMGVLFSLFNLHFSFHGIYVFGRLLG